MPHPLRTSETDALTAVFGPGETATLWVVLGIALGALVFAAWLVRQVLAAPTGSPTMVEIARAIQAGAKAYLRRQLRTVSVFIVVLAFVLAFALPVPQDAAHTEVALRLGRSAAFVLGAGFSALTGYAGMWLAVRANVRTAQAARSTGLRAAMRVAFRAGGVAGMFTVGLGLLGATGILLVFGQDATTVLVGFGFGGALLAMFMRVGGGIFTKAADVGADLVGKVEQGIPEDDPRNAATIADNVGDNVGDCAGMAADLFESYEVTLVAALILGAAALADSPAGAIAGVMFPLVVRAIGVITSIVGILAVQPRSEDEHGMRSINRGFFLSAVVSALAVLLFAQLYLHDLRPAVAVCLGLVLAGVIQVLTQYFTDTRYKPVREVAESTRTGPATTILSGFSLGMESTVYALLTVGGVIAAAAVLATDPTEALYFISLTGMGMLTTVGVVVSMDTYGPISDNAQGIAEMSGEFEGRPARVLGDLDAVGNSTKAITKGIAIATAVIAATSLFGSFEEALRAAGMTFEGVRVDRPLVLVGLLVGGSVAFLFSSLAIRAVSRAAAQVVLEVREQFRSRPGLMGGTEKPDYARVVDLCTRTSLRELLTPGLLAVLSPVVVGFALGAEALGAFLAGTILTGQLLAVMLSTSGGAWDNAKKYIEDGNLGGKGSAQHTAAVIGDTVGDPFKDTAGPSLNPLIKVMNLVALLLAPLVVTYADAPWARTVVTVAGAAVLAGAVWWSRSRPPVNMLASGTVSAAEPQVDQGEPASTAVPTPRGARAADAG
ncbi:sodium-translocating pyrophosphatase [Cellulomonas soli]|uniref:K(+)-insensitive pyrophosphate-energized proton pump n=1 Tax=Cellulomonas soli TaxID=931535 RepID=A0A512PDC2_9CELL|nr:sodium-translocating pyrophosphatase [Cellulomonas soli]NYI60144.1 K(+)-stimulated pyrophosphate-energized sodium pump [Cellulomonas soli]GEP69203.1 K(+)-insensitive pyrophosphate-energized proton pump [Cellulomonas soli]